MTRKQEFDQKSYVFQKLPFPLGVFFDENNVVKLVVAQLFFRIDVLKNFGNFTGKHP